MRIVSARSCALIPVVIPSAASTETANQSAVIHGFLMPLSLYQNDGAVPSASEHKLAHVREEAFD